MKVCVITGSGGLIGSESVLFYKDQFDLIIGIDNDQRAYLFGQSASTRSTQKRLEEIPTYVHYNQDIREFENIAYIFNKYNSDIKLVIHTAAQPSHDWAAKEPLTDFTINANGTLNLLECTRRFSPEAVFIFTSTNKVYGDRPNDIRLGELKTRYEPMTADFFGGIDEDMSIDDCKHSLFGASKVAADILVQEYGKYFGMFTGVFRGGCLTGPNHQGAMLHGFLSYLVKCCKEGLQYSIYGYKGKQVRDNIHSYDLVNAFDHYYKDPKQGEVYNIGGGRHSNCSVLEAIELIEGLTGKKLNYSVVDEPRIGDHKWYISDVSKFKSDYPKWEYKYNLLDTLKEMVSI